MQLKDQQTFIISNAVQQTYFLYQMTWVSVHGDGGLTVGLDLSDLFQL